MCFLREGPTLFVRPPNETVAFNYILFLLGPFHPLILLLSLGKRNPEVQLLLGASL